jgi:hypothetical protein
LLSWKLRVAPSPVPMIWSVAAGVCEGAQLFQSSWSRQRKP